MRPVSQGVDCGFVAIGEPAGVLRGDPAYRTGGTKGALSNRPVEDRASAATTQRLEHAAFGGATSTGRMERPHGSGGGFVRSLSKDGARPGAGGKQGSGFPADWFRRARGPYRA